MLADFAAKVYRFSRGRPRGGPFGAVVTWLAVAPFAVWLLLRAVEADRYSPFAQFGSFTPYVAPVAVVPVVIALGTGRRRAAAVALVVVAGFGVALLPRALPGPNPAVPADAPTLRVLSVNTLAGSADAGQIVDLARSERADVLCVQELTPQGVEALDTAGLAGVLPYAVTRPFLGAAGTGVYSRLPLTDAGQVSEKTTFAQVKTRVSVGGRTVEVIAAHPAPPIPGRVPRWRADFAELPGASADGPLRVMAGDFNASLDHAVFRHLVDAGYADAASAAGQGLYPTWPADGRTLVQIDHVLADERIAVRAVRIHTVAGTDHRAVFAELAVPRE